MLDGADFARFFAESDLPRSAPLTTLARLVFFFELIDQVLYLFVYLQPSWGG
jgi:hypothetical protein